MSKWSRLAYTLVLLCLPTCVWISGCSQSQDSAPDASATSDDDSMEPPTVTMPDEEAGNADDSADDEGSSDG